MKKLIGFALLLVACRGSMTPSSTLKPAPSGPGAATASAAVTAFLAAAKAGDLQAFALAWGDEKGPARDNIARDELEKREVFLIRCLRHDKATQLSDAQGASGTRVLSVQLTAGALTRSTNFTAVVGPSNRWYVKSFEQAAVNDICLMR